MDLLQLKALMADPLWRLCNLYRIIPGTGGDPVPFRPRPEQLALFQFLLDDDQGGNAVIVKSRRLGFSTALGVFVADCLAFRTGYSTALIDRTKADAEKKLRKIVRTALDSLPSPIRATLHFPVTNNSSLSCAILGSDKESTFTAGMNARGDGYQFLWISEWGVIQFEDPNRSEEILTGAIPAAKQGRVVVETTWKGGKSGDLWKIVERCLSQDPTNRWKLFFFPWYADPSSVQAGGTIPDRIRKYFADVEPGTGHTFTDDQKRWYATQESELGRFMFREFPTTLAEAFRAPIEGALYQDLVDTARAEGRIIERLPVDGASQVHTSWDLGSPQNTTVWYWQILPYGQGIRIIDVDTGENLTLAERVSRMASKGYNYGTDFIPHDAASQNYVGTTFQAQLTAAGRKNSRVVPRCSNVWDGVNLVRQMFPSFTFRLPHCAKGIEALEVVRTRPIQGGVGNELVHDWSLHPADALRMMAEAINAGLVPQSRQHATPRRVEVVTDYRV